MEHRRGPRVERPTTVLHVLEALEGGTARHLVDIVRHAVGVRHVVAVPPRRVGGVTDELAAGRIGEAGGEVHAIDMRRSPVTIANARATAKLVRLTRSVRPDVIHGHSSVGGALARAVGLATQTPVVWTPNGVMEHPLVTRVERALARTTARVIAVSESEAQLITRLRLARPGTLDVIPNGIEPDGAEPRSLRTHLGLGDDVTLVGCVARLAPQKAPGVLLEAWRSVAEACPGAILVWIGDGPDAAVMRSASANDPSLRWVPALPDAARYLGDLDVFVLASRYEGAPYAPLEAMRAGVPVVLTDVVGNRDVVESGRTGLLVPPGDPAAVAAAILRLLGDQALRKDLGAAGSAEVEANRDVHVNVGRLTGVYRSILAEQDVLASPDSPNAIQHHLEHSSPMLGGPAPPARGPSLPPQE